MKKAYESPEAEIITFVPDEELANTFWNTWGAGTVNPLSEGTPASGDDGDIEIPVNPKT